ncbi:uncharacterized protein LOC144328507 isoform X1 [Podarcis muralis]
MKADLRLVRESHEPGAENLPMDSWPWSNEEESPFKGLPPLPKVFREPSLPSFSLPGEGEQEAAQELEGGCPGLQDKIAWVHGEMLRLRRADQALFRHLYTLALEIQDLKELQLEMEIFSREELLVDEQGHVRDTAGAATNVHSAAAFEMTI